VIVLVPLLHACRFKLVSGFLIPGQTAKQATARLLVAPDSFQALSSAKWMGSAHYDRQYDQPRINLRLVFVFNDLIRKFSLEYDNSLPNIRVLTYQMVKARSLVLMSCCVKKNIGSAVVHVNGRAVLCSVSTACPATIYTLSDMAAVIAVFAG
jgi:hypothetical protein